MLTTPQQRYANRIVKWFPYTLFRLYRFPTMLFWGVTVSKLNEDRAEVSMRYSYRSQNPFKSIYFSALFGAAELSTGVLVQMYIQGPAKWSMLVVEAKAVFKKKATGKITFCCDQGQYINSQLEIIKGNGVGTFELTSSAINEEGVEVGIFHFTWSLKYKGGL